MSLEKKYWLANTIRLATKRLIKNTTAFLSPVNVPNNQPSLRSPQIVEFDYRIGQEESQDVLCYQRRDGKIVTLKGTAITQDPEAMRIIGKFHKKADDAT